MGEEILKRQERLVQYCCSQLFGIVEEDHRDRLAVKLEYFSPPHYEGAHNWRLTLRDHPEVRESLLINYCPFCGSQIQTPTAFVKDKPVSPAALEQPRAPDT